MRPEIWGPHAWIFLHSVTLEYPDNPTDEDKQNMINFINSLGYVLPCIKCRNNFKIHLTKFPLTDKVLETKQNLVYWLIDIHNCVNDIKKTKKLSYAEGLGNLLEHYENDKDKDKSFFYILTFIILFLVVLVVLGYIFLK